MIRLRILHPTSRGQDADHSRDPDECHRYPEEWHNRGPHKYRRGLDVRRRGLDERFGLQIGSEKEVSETGLKGLGQLFPCKYPYDRLSNL